MLQIFHHLFDDAHADDLLRLLGRAADVGRSQHGVESQQRLARGRRLGLENVQCGAAHVARFDSPSQRVAIHQLAAGAIHDAHALLHHGERRVVEHALRLGGERNVQRDVIALRVQLIPADQGDAQIGGALGVDEGIGGDHLHPEGSRALHYFAADAAQAHHAQGLTAQLRSEELFLLPLAALGGGVGLRNGAGHGQHQSQRVLRHRYGVAAGRVHDQNAGGGGGLEVDVIDAHARAPDDPQLGSLRQHVLIHLDGAPHQQRVGISEVLRVGFRIGDHNVPTRLRLEQFNARGSERLGNQNLHRIVETRRTLG